MHSKVLVLLSDAELAEIAPIPDKNTIISAFVGKKKIFRQHVDLLNKSSEIKAAYIWTSDVTTMWQEFTEAFHLVVAAGGLVENAHHEILVFLRLGVWDLPKGKIDPGEMPSEAAVREVQEECGLQEVHLGEFICFTFHMYPMPKKMALKKTWWYRMHTPELVVVPQTEEGIETVQWESKESVLARINDFYANLHDVLWLGADRNTNV